MERFRSFATLSLSGLILLMVSLPASAQVQRQFSNSRGATSTTTVNVDRNDGGGITGTRQRVTTSSQGDRSEVNYELSTDGSGNGTINRDHTITGAGGNTVTCNSTRTWMRGSGWSTSGSCNP
jgi:hypothetical protein